MNDGIVMMFVVGVSWSFVMNCLWFVNGVEMFVVGMVVVMVVYVVGNFFVGVV